MFLPPRAACFWRVILPSSSIAGKYSDLLDPRSAAADLAWNHEALVRGLLRSARSSTWESDSVAPGWRYSAGIAGAGGGVGAGSRASEGGCQGRPGAGDTPPSTEREAGKDEQPATAMRAAAAIPGTARFLFMRFAWRFPA